MRIKNLQAAYPFEGYVTKSVNCQGAEMQIKLEWDRRSLPELPGMRGGDESQPRGAHRGL